MYIIKQFSHDLNIVDQFILTQFKYPVNIRAILIINSLKGKRTNELYSFSVHCLGNR